MKFAGAVLLVLAGYFAWQQFKPVPPPPPPPAPPPILSEPAPLISEAEQQKILRSTEDPDPNVRTEAVALLEKMHSKAAVPVMLRMLQKDPDPTLRSRVCELLQVHRGPQAVRAVLAATRDTEPDVRISALRALDGLGDYTIAGAIASGPLKDPDENVRLQALKTLNSLQDKREKEIDQARQSYEAERQRAAEEAKKRR